MAVLLDPTLPPGFKMSSAETLPGMQLTSHLEQVTAMRRVKWFVFAKVSFFFKEKKIFILLFYFINM